MNHRLTLSTLLSLFTTLSAGCDVCIGDCLDGGAGSSDDGSQATTSLGVTSTSGGTWGASDDQTGATDSFGGASDSFGGATDDGPSGNDDGPSATDDGPGDAEETEGLGCGGMEMPPDVVDMKMVRAGDMVPPPAGYSADTRFLVLRSQGSVCGPDPLAPPDCGDAEEFTLVVVVPPEFQEVGIYDFGDYESETGFGEADLESWIHIGGTASCETGVLPNSALLFIDTLAPDGSITGQICNFYWMEGLGQGLSGYLDAPEC